MTIESSKKDKTNIINLSKYQWNFRILLVKTPSRQDSRYQKIKDSYKTNLKKFHSYYVKMITRVDPKLNKPVVQLIGFDGTIKKTYENLIPSKIFSDIDQMPMGSLRKPKNMSLYSDYHPTKSMSGLGFKNAETAKKTIKKIKNKSITYQKQVVDTMIGRAKYHPYQTDNMKDAIQIFKSYKVNKLSDK